MAPPPATTHTQKKMITALAKTCEPGSNSAGSDLPYTFTLTDTYDSSSVGLVFSRAKFSAS